MTKLDNNSRRTDADRRDDAEVFLSMWSGSKKLSVEEREDFITGWVGWHSGVDFEHECDVRDRLDKIMITPNPLLDIARKAES